MSAPTITIVETSRPLKRAPVTGNVPADSGTVFLDEVAECLLDAESVEAGPTAAADFDRSSGVSRSTLEAHCYAAEQLIQVDFVPSDREGSFVQSREKQKVLGELRQAVAFISDGAQGGFQVVSLAWALEGELDLRPQVGEWCSQLVAGVGDEAPLSLQRRFQPAEHLVERLAQSCDLVPGGRDGETLGEPLGGDRCRAAAHSLDRTQCGGRDQVADQGGNE